MRPSLKTSICIAIAVAIVALEPVPGWGRDRPAAPHGVDLLDCGIYNNAPILCGAFQIDLTDNPPFDVEKVRIESNLLEDGKPVNAPLYCYHLKHVGYLPSYPSPAPQLNQAPFQCGSYPVGNGQAEFLIGQRHYGSSYCITLRSRRVSDNVVSANWSPPACVRMRPMPRLPSKPDVSVRFITGQNNMSTTVQGVAVAYPSLSTVDGETATVSCDGQVAARINPLKKLTSAAVQCFAAHSSDPNSRSWIEVKVCEANPAGESCTTKTFDLNAHREVAIKQTGVQPGATYANSLFVGKWTVSSNTGGGFELQFIQLTGGVLFGEMTDGIQTDKGTLRGSLSDALHTQLTFKQPGINRAGTVNIALSSNGDSFTASGWLSNDQPFTWQGTKQHPVSH
jgi:hypothetical protein